ncbi:MAG: 5-oxoprolinase subunit PxpB [Saprospiraceae bacterium]
MEISIKPYGDRALLVNFEQKIDPVINEAVIALGRSIEKEVVEGLDYLIPAYCSLTVGFDPRKINFLALSEVIQRIHKQPFTKDDSSPTLLHIPVCYEEGFGLDFDDLTQQTGLSKSAIIKLHTSIEFRVYMLGFLPGFVYMGRLPDALFCQRKTNPRLRVQARSVGLAGYQTGIYPSEAPGGWQIIGRTPIKTFDPNRAEPFLFKAGDLVRFQQISVETFAAIEHQATVGQFNLDTRHEQ